MALVSQHLPNPLSSLLTLVNMQYRIPLLSEDIDKDFSGFRIYIRMVNLRCEADFRWSEWKILREKYLEKKNATAVRRVGLSKHVKSMSLIVVSRLTGPIIVACQ